MNHWAFVAGAYGATVAATLALIFWAWLSMRRAEAAADKIKSTTPAIPSGQPEKI